MRITLADILFVGDTYKTDVCGAYQAGLKVAWINRNKETDVNCFAAYQIRSVTELAELINV
ncbi:MAG: HAD hydrolase-like protein [Lachnospiraceae bacterium]|nr:HAD hydrolase-like protein [Lachnospiraceae bacterium]